MNVLCCTCCYCNSYMCVLWVYLQVPLPGLDVLLDDGLYLFLLLILHCFSTFLHFYIPTHLHRLLLMSYHWSLFCLSCHYCQTVNIYFIIYPSFSLSILYFLSLGWEHLLHLMSVSGCTELVRLGRILLAVCGWCCWLVILCVVGCFGVCALHVSVCLLLFCCAILCASGT